MNATRVAHPKASRRALWNLGRALLFVGGLGFVGFLVKQAGARQVAEVLAQAAPWLVPILALESAFLVCETLAIRGLIGKTSQRVPRAAWVRSATLAYALMVLLPAGRAAGEVARATELSHYVEKGKATFAGARLGGASLLAISAMSAIAAPIARFWGEPGSSFAALLAVNAVATAVLGTAIVALSHSRALKRRLVARFPSLDHGSHDGHDENVAPLPVGAALLCFGARCAQVVQYGIVLCAVGGVLTVPRAVLASGAHLVSASAGDLVPAQMGVNEGAYSAFAGALGLGHAPERAVAIALVIRVAQLMLASLCLTIATFVVPRVKKPD